MQMATLIAKTDLLLIRRRCSTCRCNCGNDESIFPTVIAFVEEKQADEKKRCFSSGKNTTLVIGTAGETLGDNLLQSLLARAEPDNAAMQLNTRSRGPLEEGR
jgi:hypothetical protein